MKKGYLSPKNGWEQTGYILYDHFEMGRVQSYLKNGLIASHTRATKQRAFRYTAACFLLVKDPFNIALLMTRIKIGMVYRKYIFPAEYQYVMSDRRDLTEPEKKRVIALWEKVKENAE